MAALVVPVEGDADVAPPVPFGLDLVVVLDGALEVEGVFGADVFDAEVVDDQCELHWAPVVLPEARDELALPIAVLVESFLEEFVRKEAGLREAVHASTGFDVDGAVLGGDAGEVVLADDFVRDVCQLDPDVLLLLEGRLEVEI